MKTGVSKLLKQIKTWSKTRCMFDEYLECFCSAQGPYKIQLTKSCVIHMGILKHQPPHWSNVNQRIFTTKPWQQLNNRKHQNKNKSILAHFCRRGRNKFGHFATQLCFDLLFIFTFTFLFIHKKSEELRESGFRLLFTTSGPRSQISFENVHFRARCQGCAKALPTWPPPRVKCTLPPACP